jgi:hypothetical protein
VVEALAAEAMRAMTTNTLKTAAVAILAAVGLAGAGAATVWACGGVLPRTAPPVSEAKPFPFESIATTEAKPDESAAWARPAPREGVAPGTDRAAAAGDAGAAKPARFVMLNPARDITIVTDRHETFVEFFRRQPVLVARVPANVRDKILYSGKGTADFTFVDDASFNVDGPRVAVYGTSIKIAPVPFDTSVFYLLEMAPANAAVVLVRDPIDKNLWHAAGFTKRPSAGFFTGKERVKPDDFAPADLLESKPKAEKK